MRSKSFIGAVAAVLGMAASGFSTRRPYDGFTSGLKRAQWHNPTRRAAAAEKRTRRCIRNLRHADADGYGKEWVAH